MANAQMEEAYLIVPRADWPSFVAQANSRGIGFIYSEEDDGIYVFAEHVDELADMAWAITALNEYERAIRCAEPVMAR